LLLLIEIDGEMEHLFSLPAGLMEENFKLKLKLDKLESMYLFLYHFLCSLSQEIRSLLEEI